MGTSECFIIIIILVLPVLIYLIDVLKSNFKGNDKIMWVLLLIFLNIIGALLYKFIGEKQKIKE